MTGINRLGATMALGAALGAAAGVVVGVLHLSHCRGSGRRRNRDRDRSGARNVFCCAR
jgi:hypothetical protein